jgi:glycolate oxidase
LPEILKFISEVSERHDIKVVNVFHAGDGNLHPILLFDERDAQQIRRVMLASDEILEKCIELGGSVTGEHGIGVEKINFMNRLFTDEDLLVMEDVRKAFNPEGRCSPGKLLPVAGACGMEHIEKSHPGRKAAM